MGIFLVGLWCAVLAVIDIKCRRLPDVLTLPGALLINLWALTTHPQWMLGGLFWAGIYFLTAVLVGGIGGGDIKLALGLGTAVAALGMQALMVAIVGSSLISVLLGGIFAAVKGVKRPKFIPHGPSMVIASACSYVAF
ncbi:signal peptidase [[Brevibacterium] flavum]|uniref:Signal peptidase n=1 Tax=[Brevibacterium] flavum TaxID=92706 RepID=A0A0F6Z5R0_9CORY|nr:A24 family peptidase [Corynebacterium glutamicum]AKF27590.1 signal peptidase [[Brevibacterium] flavum]ANE08419.1 signal peptidase [Corynebacterium glutamicum]AST20839.1 prepilin peptidase [Corynebacterium glutamicum ATCC 14067]KEI23337.1 signal peptidase [Corynebacterium glutamicum ATCC 14067]KIH73594.1 signal peptidase [Corynebacterium glutamicum]